MLLHVQYQIKSSKTGTSAAAATGAGASSSRGALQEASLQRKLTVYSLTGHTQGNEKQSYERRFVTAMLSLSMAIRNTNVMSKEDFAGAIHEDAALVKKLAEILRVNKNSAAE